MIFVSPLLLKLFTGRFASSITLWPFVFLRHQKYKEDPVLLNHEKIHLQQQLELCILFFYLWYGIEFLRNRLKGMNSRTAYYNISFEKEAYEHEKDVEYLKRRKFWGFLKYFKF